MRQLSEVPEPDAQLGELIETVFECEREWVLDDRIKAAIKYGR